MPLFVVQKHAARSTHYDFRLETEGVLKSWALPKGPSLDPSQKRLAVFTEDHAMEYARFEGVIAEGQYGAGPVIVWDLGEYRDISKGQDFPKSLETGKLEIWLEGSKLKGGFALFRMGAGDSKNWLLKKMKDEYASPGIEITAASPKSVISGKSIEEIQTGKD